MKHFRVGNQGGAPSSIVISTKADSSWVSEVDRSSERTIAETISRSFAVDGFLGEEGEFKKLNPENGRIWIVDPLDGTTNYLRGLPFFATSIALVVAGEPVVAVVEAPALGWRFEATKGGGTTLNGRRVEVKVTESLEKAFLATGFFFSDYPTLDEGLAIFRRLVPEVAGVRRAGAAALDLSLVAAGVYDGYWEKGLKAWDMAAGALLVKEAGGEVARYDRSALDLFGGEVVAATPTLASLLFKAISPR